MRMMMSRSGSIMTIKLRDAIPYNHRLKLGTGQGWSVVGARLDVLSLTQLGQGRQQRDRAGRAAGALAWAGAGVQRSAQPLTIHCPHRHPHHPADTHYRYAADAPANFYAVF